MKAEDNSGIQHAAWIKCQHNPVFLLALEICRISELLHFSMFEMGITLSVSEG
jgi:hypothetical protein